jgi:hypothetical protein
MSMIMELKLDTSTVKPGLDAVNAQFNESMQGMAAASTKANQSMQTDSANSAKAVNQLDSEVKQTTEGFNVFGKSGIFAMTSLRREMAELYRQMTDIRTQMAATKDQETLTRLRAELTDAQAKFTVVRGELRGMRLEMGEARETVNLLGESMGVKLGGGVAGLLSKLPGVQAALGAAFEASVVIFFVQQIYEGVKALEEMEEAASGTGKVINQYFAAENIKKFMAADTVAAAQQVVVHFNNLRMSIEEYMEVAERIKSQSLSPLSLVAGDPKDLARAKELGDQLKASGVDLTKISEARVQNFQRMEEAQANLAKVQKESGQQHLEVMRAENSALTVGENHVMALRSQYALLNAEERTQVEEAGRNLEKISGIHEIYAAKRIELEKQISEATRQQSQRETELLQTYDQRNAKIQESIALLNTQTAGIDKHAEALQKIENEYRNQMAVEDEALRKTYQLAAAHEISLTTRAAAEQRYTANLKALSAEREAQIQHEGMVWQAEIDKETEKTKKQAEELDKALASSMNAIIKSNQQAADSFARLSEAQAQSAANLRTQFRDLTKDQQKTLVEYFGSQEAVFRSGISNAAQFADAIHANLSFAGQAMQDLRNTAQDLESKMSSALGQSIAASIVYGESIGKAMAAATKAVLANLAAQAIGKAIFETAEGFAALARMWFGDPKAAHEAAMHFEAAAIYGTIGGAAAGLGRAIPGGGTRAPAPSATVGAGAAQGPPQLAPGMAARQPGAQPQIGAQGHVTVLVMGTSQTARWLTSTINNAVVQQGMQLTSTRTKNPPYAAR